MEVLMCRDLILIHPLFKRETKKEIDMLRFYLNYSSVMSSLPKEVPKVIDFLS